MFNKISLFIFSSLIAVALFSCKKDKFLTDPSAQVSFSQDSVLFDTVFTTIGSTTRNIKVINKNKQKINISSVRLEQGNASFFTLNVDGTAGKQVNDVEILAEDSIYIFIQVNINPTNSNNPLVIQDKILFDINGNQQSVALEAWGQDAYYHFPNKAIQYKTGFFPYSTVSSQTTQVTVNWINDKPHVIYGWLVVDSAQTLTIAAGVKVYMHKNAGLWVFRYGALQVNGSQGNEVVFQGDRRELNYADAPGQWDRIWINEGSTANWINHAIIKNSYIGVQADLFPFFIPPNTISYDLNAPRRLKISNTVIRNCSKWGLYTSAFNVWSGNNVISNCQEYCAAITSGGKCTFVHTTFANYFNKEKGRGEQPCVHVDNYDGTNVWPFDSLYFGNCIVDGSKANELETDIRSTTGAQKYIFSNCLLKTASFTGTMSVANSFGSNADFVDATNYDLKLKSTSGAKTLGSPVITSSNAILSSDIIGISRTTLTVNPSAGAYQFQ